MKIDHLVLWCADYNATSEQLFAETGLASRDGGWFPSEAIGQRIVPLGNGQFLEIESKLDDAKFREFAGPVASFMDDAVREHPCFLTFWVRTDDIESAAARLGVDVWTVRKTMPDGREMYGKTAPPTLDAIAQGLPVFLWLPEDSPHASRMSVTHRAEPERIAWLELGGTEDRIAEWLGPEWCDLPLRFTGESPGITALGIAMRDGSEIVLRPTAGGLCAPA